MRAGHRLATITSVVATLNLFLAAAAMAQVTPDDVVAGLDQGVYIQVGAESVDVDRLATVTAAAATEEIYLHIVVLADSVDAVSFAQTINDRVPGTILVFTPDEYGASSSDLSQGRMSEALDDASDELAGDDIVAGASAFVAGASAFVAAATPTSRPWVLLIAAGLLLLVVVAVVGRGIERRATAQRRAAALARRWAELRQRADVMSDPILELSTRVEIDGRPEMADRYRAAASRYGELSDELARSPEAKRVDGLDKSIAEVERELAALRSEVATR
jgi:hypothetical protein